MTDSEKNENLKKFQDEIVRLAKLNEDAYELERDSVAKFFNIRLSKLDDLVKDEKIETGEKKEGNILFPNTEPWSKEVNLSDLLELIVSTINKFIVLQTEHEVVAIALWIIQTYFVSGLECAPNLHIKSPEKRCGKSTLVSLLMRIVHKGIYASNISAPALFRLIEEFSPTLGLDEADTFIKENEELRGIINSGHDRAGAFVVRCIGEDHQLKRFSTFGSKIIAGIGDRADTIEDRSVNIVLRRKLTTEKKAKLSILNKTQQKIFDEIKQKCIRFVADNKYQLCNANPVMPEMLNDRESDNWHALLSLAILAGGIWPIKAIEAAKYLSSEKQAIITIGVELLIDIQEIFELSRHKSAKKIFSSELLDELNKIDDSLWSTFNRGKFMTARQLSNRLKDYNIKPKQIRISHESKKGFEISQFEDAWVRYIPSDTSDFNEAPETSKQAAVGLTGEDVLSETVSVRGLMQSETFPDQFGEEKLHILVHQDVSDNYTKQSHDVSVSFFRKPSLDLGCFDVSDKVPFLQAAQNVVDDSIDI
jgi:putative DNA primase/helicase